jgi:hypothetical protein
MARNRRILHFRSFLRAGNALSATMKMFALGAVAFAFAATLERLKRPETIAATTLLALLLAPL